MRKRMYHGTVDVFVNDIRQNGLMPSKEHAWQVSWDDGEELREHEKVNSVFLTPDKHHAVQYAKTRQAYFAASPGGTFPMFDNEELVITKDRKAPVLYTRPVIVVLEIDDPVSSKLKPDPHDPYEAMCYRGTIPPSMIVDVLPVTDFMARTLSEEYKKTEEYTMSAMLSAIFGQPHGSSLDMSLYA